MEDLLDKYVYKVLRETYLRGSGQSIYKNIWSCARSLEDNYVEVLIGVLR